MTQAPATTVATAVRQHGGGRHPLNLLRTAPAGRLQDSRGGVIKRRAEGATSSNTLPASCAAAAHPTTGVRRARELSPSLRSQSCQHAQLVEGYTTSGPHHTAKQWIQLDEFLQVLFEVIPRLCKGAKQGSGGGHIDANLQDANEHRKVKPEFRRNHQPGSTLVIIQVARGSLHDSIEEINISLPHTKPSIGRQRGPVDCWLEASLMLLAEFLHPAKRTILVDQLLSSPQRFPDNGIQTHTLSLLTSEIVLPLHSSRHCNCHDQSQNGASSLHPSRTCLACVHRQHQEVSCSEDHDNTRHRNRQMFLCPLPPAVVPHHHHLNAKKHRASLPAPCHHVQREAA